MFQAEGPKQARYEDIEDKMIWIGTVTVYASITENEKCETKCQELSLTDR